MAFQTGPVNTFHSCDLLRQLFFVDIEISRLESRVLLWDQMVTPVLIWSVVKGFSFDVFTSHEYSTEDSKFRFASGEFP